MAKYAIVGTACLFPDAATPDQFWRNLVDGVDSRRDGGAEVFGADLPDDPDRADGPDGPDGPAGREHRIYCTRGGFVTGFEFDATGYLLAPQYLQGLDRVFQWPLQMAREALCDAGRAGGDLSRAGLVLGNYSFPTLLSSRRCLPLWEHAVFDGLRKGGLEGLDRSGARNGTAAATQPEPLPENLWAGGWPARVLGAALGLGGTQYAIDAACSSALYSLQLACDHLATGQVDLMLAGAVCAPDPVLLHLSFSDLGAYPQDGFSQPFDADSKGIVTGQGAAMVAVRRLADALRDGDRIHAVIEGAALTNDGAGRHLLVPNPSGQLDAYRLAYQRSAVDPAQVSYVEGHATGTPVGDQVELDTIADFFGAGSGSGAESGRAEPPLLGSVKANVGHLLTVAGFTSLLKVVLAMRHGMIPPTPGVASPLGEGTAKLATEAVDWPADGGHRRAGVSAFGFGGTNVHLVLAEPAAARDAAPDTDSVTPPRLAITGMGCHLGQLGSLDEFERAGYTAQPAFGELPANRWRGFEDVDGPLARAGLTRDAVPDGAFVDGFDFDSLGMRIPPAELDHFNAQHLLMLRVAQEALSDAGFDRAVQEPRRVAVVIAMEMEPSAHGHLSRLQLDRLIRQRCEQAGLDLTDEQLTALVEAARGGIHDGVEPNEVLSYIGNVMAARVSSLWNFTGPSFTVSADSSSAVRALEVAQLLLLDETVDAVLVGAVDLAGGPENMHARASLVSESGHDGPGLAFGAGADGWRVGEGAAAVVVTREHQAQRCYASIDAIRSRYPAGSGCSVAGLVCAEDVRAAAHEALEAAGVAPADVGYVEASASGAGDEDVREVNGLSGVYTGQPLSCALGSARSLVGDGQCAGSLASVVRTALCLYHGYLPAAPGWQAPKPKLRTALETSAFHVPTESTPWLRGSSDRTRHAAVSVIGTGGTVSHLVMSGERVFGEDRPVDWDRGGGGLLLPVVGDDAESLLAALRETRDLLNDPEVDPRRLARDGADGRAEHRLCVVLVAGSREKLLRELDQAIGDLPKVCADGGEWRTPAGSFFTGDPIGPDGKLALVFPGAFNSYVGLGRDLFRAFPGLLAKFATDAERPAELIRAHQLYPPSLTRLDRTELMHHETAMIEDIPSMLATGTSFAVLHTDLLRELLGIEPAGAFGYSLGESSMMFAMGGWEQSARTDQKITATPLFKDRLCGPKRTVRELWGLDAGVPDVEVWATYVLLASPDDVRAELPRFDRAFLTHINTPREVVVAGAPDQVKALVEAVGCQAARAPANHVMHCDVVEGEQAELADLNRYPARELSGVELLTADGCTTVDEFETEAIATRIGRTLCRTVDFAGLVRTAYDRGFRYFVEVGPGGTCARWVDDTLGDAPHVAVALDRRGTPAANAIAQALARLISHGLPATLTPLYQEERAATDSRSAQRRIEPGATPVSTLVAQATQAALSSAGSAGPATPAAMSSADAAMSFAGAAVSAGGNRSRADVITFDGEPFDQVAALTEAPALTATAPPGAAGTPTAHPVPAAVPAPVPSPVQHGRNGQGNGAAALLRETRQQVLATHRAFMAAQRSLADHALRVLEGDPDTGPPGTQQRTQPATQLAPRRDVVWDEGQLLEFATGKVANVFGERFAEVDTYARRVRLPAPPYLFVSRVVELDAEPGRFEPSSVSTEYDVPHGAWYLTDGQVPPAVAIEAGQSDLLLISYLGVDFRNRGERLYRLLDSTLTFHGDLPTEGQTLRYDISIDNFLSNADALLFFFSYRCYAEGELILELKQACAGFFTQNELNSALGVVDFERRRELRKQAVTPFRPLARTAKDSLDEDDLARLSQGRIAEVFGDAYRQDGCNPSLRLPDERLRMLDRVDRIDPTGGPRGLGAITATKRLDPDGWYFDCHFPDDPVLAGSLVAEGAVQLLQTYALHRGLHLCLPQARFQPVPGLQTEVQVRGQITPDCTELRYEADVIELDLLPMPHLVADVFVHRDGKPIMAVSNLGIRLAPEPGSEYKPGEGGVVKSFLGRRNRNGEPAMLNELHMAHAAKGDLAIAMGPEFGVYADRKAPYIPNGDFLFVDRVMRLDGERGRLERGSVMVTEYDSPPEAWYYAENAFHGMPNCVHMETSLQAAILLGYYLGATLPTPEEELSIRNLDGRATVTSDVGLSGRIILQESTLQSHTTGAGGILQSFEYALTADGEPFYEGESLFGYFSQEALANQLGLDGGKPMPTWLQQQDRKPPARRLELRGEQRWHEGSLRLGRGHLDLVDWVDVVDGGGEHGVAYLSGYRRIRPQDWYFDCHFHKDPVMPGSLGIEAIIQALQAYVIDAGLADGMPEPTFAMPLGVPMSWKYRGQILRDDPDMPFELHVKQIRRDDDRLLVLADASLWKADLRIYEVTDLAVQVNPQPKEGLR